MTRVRYLPIPVLSVVLVGCASDIASPPDAPLFHSSSGGFPVVLTGIGTANVDGALNADEWAGAGTITLDANLPPSEGGGTTPVTFYVMNDLDNLYLALEMHRAVTPGSAISTGYEFDNDHSGVGFGEGDDALVANVDPSGPTGAKLIDDFRTLLPPCPAGAACGFRDVDRGGSNDGEAAATWDATHTYLELSHPLDSDDDAHDFSLAADDVVGVALLIRFIAPGSVFPDDFGDTNQPFGWGDIVIAQMPPDLLVGRLLELTAAEPGLTALLEATLRSITADRPEAVRLLQAFIVAVESMVRSGALTAQEGAELIALAEAAITGLTR